METDPLGPDRSASPLAAGPPDRVVRPARSRRHLVTVSVLAAVPAVVITSSWVTSWPPDGVDARLLALVAVVVAAVAAVADGFDRRYPTAGPGSVAVRLAGLTAVVVLVLFLVADPWVYSGTDGGRRVWPFAVGLSGLAVALAGRQLAKTTGPAPAADGRPVDGLLAVIAVSVPFGLGFSLLSFFAALCGYGPEALVLFAVGISSPVWLGLVERGLNRRWPRSGLAFAVGRLVLVAVVVSAASLVVLTVLDDDGRRCESTLSTPDAAEV